MIADDDHVQLPDESDRATEIETMLRDDKIAEIRRAATLTAKRKPTGFCLSCLGKTPKPNIFCDEFCAKDYSDRLAAHLRNYGH